MARQINREGLELIKMFEGLRLEAYLDPVGIWTIGYGHIKGVRQGQTITAQQAEELLMQDLAEFERGVERLVKVPINDNQFSALVSFSFNVGVGALQRSTALKRLNSGDVIGAANALEWWNKGRVNGELVELPGLTRRRAAEKALFLKPVEITAPSEVIEENSRIAPDQKEQPDRREHLGKSRTVKGSGVAGAAGAVGAAGAAAEMVSENTEATVPELVKKTSDLFEKYPEIYVAIGIIVVLMALWILWARIDDWRKGRR